VTILQALDRYYDRLEARGEVPARGWSEIQIGLVLELDADGSLLDVIPWEYEDSDKLRLERVPRWFSRSGTGSRPDFLWGNTGYVLGLTKKDLKNPKKLMLDHAEFKKLHLKELEAETDPGLAGLRRFLQWWEPSHGAAYGINEKLLDRNIVFRLRGETRFLYNRPAALPHIERLRSSQDSDKVEGFCLVRGERLPLVRLHPFIRGIDPPKSGMQVSAEIRLVSFNKPAFESYGKEQGYNAPTSNIAADRYGAALNQLLRRGGRNRIRIADATVAFWADASGLGVADANAKVADTLFGMALQADGVPDEYEDVRHAASVRQVLEKIAVIRAEEGVEPKLVEGVAFHVLGLAPTSKGRVATRFWLSGSFAEFADAIDAHARAIAITPSPWGAAWPTAQRLLVETTALQRESDNIPAGLAGEVTRAVLTGAPYPRAWLAAAIIRLRAGDDPRHGWHAAAIKACLSRMPKEIPVPTGLDPNNPSPGYQLGRLFAVLQAAQYAALGRVNASIADRYYGAASATPALVFGPLMRGARKHISDAQKRGKGLWIERRLEEILSRLSPELPRTLRLEEQGRFAIGYYHERATRAAKVESETEAADSEEKP
jgi:CRISPR-associated protein Csd1